MRYRVFALCAVLAFTGCQTKAHKVAQLQARYNAVYAAYTKDCPATDDTSGAARMLTGEKLTSEQTAQLEAKKKDQEMRCKPQAEQLAELQRQILAAQQ